MRNRREVVRNQKIVLVSALVLTAAIIFGAVLFSSISTQAAPAEVTYKYYTSVQIKAGDTLWEIASEYYTDDYDNMNVYIEEICELNHISEDEIHAGQYLTLPYYSTEVF